MEVGRAPVKPGDVGRQKTGEHRRKVTIFPRPSRLTRPAHRREYKFMRQLSPGTKCREIRILYIARASQRRGSLSFGRHRGDAYGHFQATRPFHDLFLKFIGSCFPSKVIPERGFDVSICCAEEATGKSR